VEKVFMCESCKHFRSDMTCKAFPRGIPDVVISGNNPHFDKIESDRNVQWEPKDWKSLNVDAIGPERYAHWLPIKLKEDGWDSDAIAEYVDFVSSLGSV